MGLILVRGRSHKPRSTAKTKQKRVLKIMGFPGGLVINNPPVNAGDMG